MIGWNAYNRFGNLLASFNAPDLAERYKAERASFGVEVTIRRVVRYDRRAA